jgi:O-antigen/teichoic acid export membrane protein
MVGVSAVWFIKAVSTVSSFLLLPVLMRVMDREELGTWMVFGNSQVFLSLLNFGVTPTLTRHIALAKGRSGADPDVVLTPETEQHIADLVATGRSVLRGLSLFTFVAALVAGVVFLGTVDFQRVPASRVYLAWLFLCAGYAVQVWVSYLECWMSGVGFVGWSAIITGIVAVLTLVANISAALLGGGLLSLACIFVAGGLVQRAALIFSLRRTAPNLFRIAGRWSREFAQNLIRPSLYTWLYFFGYFLVVQSGAFFIMKVQGADNVPSYQAAYTLLINLQMLSLSFALTSSVFLSQAWQAGDQAAVRRHTMRFAQIGLAIMAAGVGFLLTAGRDFIDLWLGPNSFVGYGVLSVLGLVYTLQAHGVILTTCARSTEDERFAVSSIAGGLLNVALIWWLIGPLGVLGVAISMLIAEMLTNGWYCVYRPFVRLQIEPRTYFRRVLLLWAATFGATFAIDSVLVSQMRDLGLSRFWIVLAAASVAGIILAAAIWWGIFEVPHRHRILTRVRRWTHWPKSQLQ